MTNLKNVIKGQKQISKLIADTLPTKLEDLRKFEGQKILKATCFLMEKVKPEIQKNLPNSRGKTGHTSCRLDFSGSMIWINYKTCLSGGSHEDNTAFCIYFDESVCIGEMEPGTDWQTLKSVNHVVWDHKNLTVKGELKKVKQYEKLKERANELKSKINHKVKECCYIR